MAILIAARFDDAEWAAWWPLLQAALPGERLLRDRGEAAPDEIDIAIVANPPAGSLRDLPALRLIQSLWAGVDRLLADESFPVSVPLARMIDPAMNDAMAETALWAVLGLQRGFFACAAQQRAGEWRQPPVRRADEARIAVLGFGALGRAVAQRLVQNGYRVTGWSRGPAAPVEGVALLHGAAMLTHMLGGAEIAINLLPLTPETRGLLGAKAFASMPKGAVLVNLARGAHVVEADLLAALASGHLAHAVLDVFATEPLPSAHPFWSNDRVTVLPHIAAPTDPRGAVAIVARNVHALRNGEPLQHLVDRTRGY
jgi:glyoxylate/hydroxypyruvate reductase